MALTANADWVTQEVQKINTKTMVVLADALVFNGALCSHDTTAGAVKPFDGTQTDRLVGWHFGDEVTGVAAGDNVYRPQAAICPGGFVVRELPVATLANDDTDFGKPVYATDDGTYTITDPGTGQVVGYVVADERRSTDHAAVLMRDLSQI